MSVEITNTGRWLRLCRRFLMALGLLLSTLLLMLWLGYQSLPIRQLQWSGLALGSQQISLAQLSLQLGRADQWWELQIQQLSFEWRRWPLPRVTVQRFELMPQFDSSANAHHGPAQAAESHGTFNSLPGWPVIELPQWIPAQLEIKSLLLRYPCQTKLQSPCQLHGALQAFKTGNNHRLALRLQGDGQEIELQLEFVTKDSGLVALHLEQAKVGLDLQALAAAGWIPGLPPGLLLAAIQLHLTGHWQPDGLQLTLRQPLQIKLSYQQPTPHGADMSFETAVMQVQGGELHCSEPQGQQCQLQLAAAVSVGQFRHPLLHASDWQLKVEAKGRLTDLQLSGSLQNPQSLQLNYQARLSPQRLHIDWQLADLFLLAGNPLQITRLWPALLDIQRGKISADGRLQLQLPSGKLNSMQLQAQLHDLVGSYDRTGFSGLTTILSLEGDPRSFSLNVPELTLQQLDHGFQAGPLQFAGQYQADWSEPVAGEVRLGRLQLAIFGGELALAATRFNLLQQAVEFSLDVRKIQLAELLKQHPSNQLLGQGVLSGVIPLRYQRLPANSSNHSLAQWQVLNGHLQAEAPGGRLQYQYQPVAGQKTSGMDLAFEALSDFRYQTLASTVDLQPDGQMLLQVKLHGFNPNLQQGRPVHFNINVEEDLPALLTSLQLSGQISDKVRQRIQQKVQQQSQ